MAQIKYNLGNLSKEKYSTDEIVIGEWIDGKPLYRKVHYNNDPTKLVLGNNNDIDIPFINADEIDSVARIDGLIGQVNSKSSTISIHSSWGSYNSIWIKVNNSTGNIQVHSENNGNSYYITTIIVEYTKTTDA